MRAAVPCTEDVGRQRELFVIAGAPSYVTVKSNCLSAASPEETAKITPIDTLA